MHMGGAGIACEYASDSFKYILINNGAHESVGGQPTIAFKLDVEGILKASGFNNVYRAETVDEVKNGIKLLNEGGKGALVIYVNQGSRDDLGRPTVSPEANKINMMKEFSE